MSATTIQFGLYRTLTRAGRRLWPRNDDDGCPIVYYDAEGNDLCYRCASRSGYSSPVTSADRLDEGDPIACDDCGAWVIPNMWDVTVNEDGDCYEAFPDQQLGWAILGDVTYGNDRTIERSIKRIVVRKTARRLGIAHELLTAICADADNTETRLYLEVAPILAHDPTMSAASLRRWYRRNGFRAGRGHEWQGWLVRDPNGWRRVTR